MKMLNTYLPPLLLLFLIPMTARATTTTDGKSFFSPQPISTMLAPQTAMFEEFARRHSDGDDRFFLSATPFYTRSNAGKNLRRLFFPGSKDELVIAGSQVPAGTDYDVSGTWLQIMGNNVDIIANDQTGIFYNNFQSKISINPFYENLGANFNFYKKLSKYFFITGEVAIVQSKIFHCFGEYNIQNQTTRQITQELIYQDATPSNIRQEPQSRLYSLNATEAFTNPFWQYGKLSTTPLTKEGVSDLALKAGLQFEQGSVFMKMIIPTSQKPTAIYMFEPLTGNGSHIGLGFGGALTVAQEYGDILLSIYNRADYVYLFSNTQLRTFDLTNGSWSRYLLMRELGNVNSDPGVNYLTLSTQVTPGNTLNWQTNIGLQFNKIGLNFGYDFSFANEEHLKLNDNNSTKQFNIASEQLDKGSLQGVINTFINSATISSPAGILLPRVIATRIIAQADATELTGENINLQSAQQPAKLVSQLNVSIEIEKIWKNLPTTVKAGGSYNIDHNKTSLEGWAIWLQVALKV